MEGYRTAAIIGVVLIAVLWSAAPACSQDSLNVHRVGETTYWMQAYYLAASGSYAYLSSGGSGLRVLDLADPAQPREVGYYNDGSFAIRPSADVAALRNLVFMTATDSHLLIFDVSEPTTLQLIGHTDQTYSYSVVAAVDSLVCVAGDGEFKVWNVVNPAAPQYLGYYAVSDNVNYMTAAGHFAYLACGDGTLRIIDLSNPAYPDLAGIYFTGSSANAVKVQDSLAYVIVGSGQLQVLNVSTPGLTFLLGSCALPGSGFDLAISGAVLYIPVGNTLQIVSVANSASPSLIGQCDLANQTAAVIVHANHALVSTLYAGVRSVDVSDPTLPQEVGWVGVCGSARACAVGGGYAYVAAMEAGLRILDVTLPSSPHEVGFCNTPGSALDVAVSGNFAYVADWSGGLRVINVTNPRIPVETGFLEGAFYVNGLTIIGNYAYLASSAGLAELDVSSPSRPTITDSLALPGYAGSVAVSNGYAYVTSENFGLTVVDVSDPAHLTQVGTYTGRLSPLDVAVLGNYAFLVDGHDSLVILDVSNPAQPVQAATYPVPAANGVVIQNHFALVSGSGLTILDIANPLAPILTGHYQGNYFPVNLTVEGDYAYVAEGYDLGIYDCSAAMPQAVSHNPASLPFAFRLNPPIPNPFNPSTVLSYELRVPSQVSLKVYDTSGRLVATLVNERQPAGTHSATFNGSGLASGIYLAKLEAGEFTAVQKLVLLK